jgi:hypothetical protein
MTHASPAIFAVQNISDRWFLIVPEYGSGGRIFDRALIRSYKQLDGCSIAPVRDVPEQSGDGDQYPSAHSGALSVLSSGLS